MDYPQFHTSTWNEKNVNISYFNNWTSYDPFFAFGPICVSLSKLDMFYSDLKSQTKLYLHNRWADAGF